MHRSPLLSELAILHEAYQGLAIDFPSDIVVIGEDYSPSRLDVRLAFNADFSLWFLPDTPARHDRLVRVVPVRPRTIGAELFVTIRNDGRPVLIEQIGAESIPLRSFVNLIDQVDSVVGDMLGSSCVNAEYLRITELKSSIAFLVANAGPADLTHLKFERYRERSGEWTTRSIQSRLLIEGVIAKNRKSDNNDYLGTT